MMKWNPCKRRFRLEENTEFNTHVFILAYVNLSGASFQSRVKTYHRFVNKI